MLWLLLALLVVFYLVYNAGYYIYMYANSQLKKGNKEKAFHWFEFGYRYTRVTGYNKIMYAAMLLKDGQIDEASQKLNYILMNEKLKDRDRYYAKAIQSLVEFKRGDLDRAIEIMENVMENCENSFNYGNLGYLYIVRGDLDQALEFSLKAHAYNGDDPLIMDNLADIYLKRGELDKAEEIFSHLMPRMPSFPDAYYHYGQYLLKQGEEEQAVSQFEKALTFPFSYISPISRQQVQAEMDAISAKRRLSDGN